jgi:hypothetical protein
MDNTLDGFATNDEEIEQLVIHHHNRWLNHNVRVEIDWENQEVDVFFIDDGHDYLEYTYTIHKIDRATKEKQ